MTSSGNSDIIHMTSRKLSPVASTAISTSVAIGGPALGRLPVEMAIGCGAPLQLGRFGTPLRQPSEHRVEPVDTHGAGDEIVDLELGLLRSRHDDVAQPHHRLLGGDAGGDVDAAHVEMRKLVGEGARISPCAGLDRPDIGARIGERTGEHQPQRSRLLRRTDRHRP